MNNYKIENVTEDLVNIFTESGYADKTIIFLKRNIKKIVLLHQNQGEHIYNSEIINNYIEEINNAYTIGSIGKSRKNSLVKSALYVREIATTGTIRVGHRECPERLNSYYCNVLEKIKSSSDWSESLKRNIAYAAHTYFVFLIDSNIQNLNMLTEEVIRKYIIEKLSNLSPNSLDTIRRNLKHLHNWLYKNKFIQHDFSDILSFTTPCVHRIKKPIPLNEIYDMFCAIDRKTSIGKRDYAMFMIAFVTGMRSIDIVNLKLSDIDWINGEIRITQQKTEVSLALPLTKDVGEAIKDYILHGRPESSFENIFLTSRPPIGPFGRRGIYSAFNHIPIDSGNLQI